MKIWYLAFLSLPVVAAGCAGDGQMPSFARPAAIQEVSSDRTIRLPNAPNFRDAGGLRTQDGRWVQTGLAYRSDQLNHMGSDELALLSQLGVRTIVDLRVAAERHRNPDPQLSQVRAIVADVFADGNYDADVLKPADWALIRSGDGDAVMRRLYREMIQFPSANHSFGALIQALATENAPVLFHCTAGKDRTGWATAVLLTALGVPRDEVVRDYLLSRDRLREKNAREIAEMIRTGDGTITAAQWEPLYDVRADYLQAAFDEVDRRYGSFDAYRRDGIGISDVLLERLRLKFLAGNLPR